MLLSSPLREIKHALSKLDPRPVAATAAFGGLVTLAVGGAYMGGVSAQASTTRTQAERISTAGMEGYSQEAMALAAGGLDASALAIAQRHDPYAVDGAALRDRQAEVLTARLQSAKTSDPASPFRMTGARDQSRDLDCLTQAVYYEARGEGTNGMKAVAQVVLNRARHPAFPKTVCSVVFQGSNRSTGCQFSFTCNGAMRAPVNRAAWNRARDVASAALSGQVYNAVGTATHFHTTAVSPSWRHRLVQVNQVGSHVFYRFGGRNGSSAALANEVQASAAVPRVMQASLTSEPTGPRPYVADAKPAEKAAAAISVTAPASPEVIKTAAGAASVQTAPLAATT
ncbi:cell wall hydrolase [Brevundimonas sp.]|uniref:cell wall hydrolase n=1 Tax=Brevundimonas sp. TaxID=1871086 RepID=UPI00289D9C79|nr:cell wall hydrolase [Brevundimonas sp.]